MYIFYNYIYIKLYIIFYIFQEIIIVIDIVFFLNYLYIDLTKF